MLTELRRSVGRTEVERTESNEIRSGMLIEIGRVEAIFRYPVKSMAGERLEAAELGWHGLEGDRRLAFRRINNSSGFPWLSASQLPDLLRFAPLRREGAQREGPAREEAA